MTKRNVITMLLIALGVSLSTGQTYAQSGPDLPFERLQAIAIQPAKMNPETNSMVVPEMLPLFLEEEIKYTGGTKYRDATLKYRLHVPENMEPGQKYPLILWLHGVGEAGDNNCDQLIHLHHLITYLTGPKKRDFFLLVPQTPEDHTAWDADSTYRTVTKTRTADELRSLASTIKGVFGSTKAPAFEYTEMVEEKEEFGDSPLGFSFAMLEQVREKYPVDPDRITVSGLSSGGDGTWRALERGPEIFAAAVPLVSWSALKDEEIKKSPLLKKIPIWAIYSSDDNGIDYAREEFARVEAAGCNVKKSEFGLCGHNAWTPAMLQADIFSWLLSRGKKNGEYVAVADSNINPDEMQGVVEVAERDSRLPTLAPPKTEPDTTTLVPTPPKSVTESSTMQASPVQIIKNPDLAQWWESIKQEPFLMESDVNDLRFMLAVRYFQADEMENVARVFRQLNLKSKIAFVRIALGEAEDHQLEYIEELINEIQAGLPEPVLGTPRSPGSGFSAQEVILPPPASVSESSGFQLFEESEAMLEISPSVRRVVEECEKEWEMSTRTLYGLFAADWDKESELVPDFVRNSTARELLRHINDAVTGNDDEKFDRICDSVLKLDNQPMSSPWFETSGGRLQSDITYSLSPRGRVLQATFRELAQSDAVKAEKRERMQKTLDKMDVILAGE